MNVNVGRERATFRLGRAPTTVPVMLSLVHAARRGSVMTRSTMQTSSTLRALGGDEAVCRPTAC